MHMHNYKSMELYGLTVMSEMMFVVEISKNGRKTNEVVDAKNSARARRQVEDENPNALICNVDRM